MPNKLSVGQDLVSRRDMHQEGGCYSGLVLDRSPSDKDLKS